MEASDLVQLFEKLGQVNDEDEFQDVLGNVKKVLDGDSGLQKLRSDVIKPYLKMGIKSPSVSLRTLTIEQIKRISANPWGIQYIQQNGLLNDIIDLVVDEVTSIAERASDTLIQIARVPIGLEIITEYIPQVTALLNKYQNDETIRFRILDLFAQLSSTSPKAFAICNEQGMFNNIVRELGSEDILEQLNALELVEKVGKSEEGLTWLEQQGILKTILDLVNSNESLISVRSIKIIGNTAKLGSFFFEKLATLPLKEPFIKHLNGSNFEAIEAVITSISCIGISQSGIQWLAQQPDLYVDLVELVVFELLTDCALRLQEFMDFSSSSNTDARICFYFSLAHMFEERQPDNKTETQTLRDIFNRISMHPPTTQLMYQYLNYHLVELRFAVFALIKAVVKHTWGLTEILAFPGMADYLLNRRTEPTKLGKEWKYSIIEAIVQQPSAKDIAGTVYYTRFLTYLKQGIFYVAAENAVQIEQEVGE